MLMSVKNTHVEANVPLKFIGQVSSSCCGVKATDKENTRHVKVVQVVVVAVQADFDPQGICFGQIVRDAENVEWVTKLAVTV